MIKLISFSILSALLLSGCAGSGPKPGCDICPKGSIYSKEANMCFYSVNIKGVVKHTKKSDKTFYDAKGNETNILGIVSTDNGDIVEVPLFENEKSGDIINVIFVKEPSCKKEK